MKNSNSISKIKKKIDSKKKKYKDLNNPKKWAPDEIKSTNKNETKKQKKDRIKQLYKDKIEIITLRKSKYPNRPQVLFCYYPEKIINLYKIEGKKVEGQIKKWINAEDDDLPYDEQIGVKLRLPPSKELFRLPPREFLRRFSVPIAKIAKVYKSIRSVMKLNGMILSKSQGYSFCWGYSKHRDQVKVKNIFKGKIFLKENFFKGKI